MALGESDPKLMAEMLNTLAEYGCAQSGPMTMRKSCDSISTEASEWLSDSKSGASASCWVPKGRTSLTDLERWYTSARCWREKGTSAVSPSIRYWRISGPIDSRP